jgi:modulator of FtsH protease
MHPFIGFLLMLGSVMGAGAVSRRPGLNVAALYGVAAIVGLVIAPAIFVAQLKASMGASLSSAPVLHAFGLATAGFTGLSAYALTTKRDFSALRGFLGMGLFVVIGASVLNLFLGASVLSLAIASVTILLFGGFVLYDTQRMLREDDLEPVPAALNLYLNFLNLFLALLRILSGGRRD